MAVLLFFGGFAAAAVSQPALIADLRAEPMLIIVFALCPLMIGVNMLTTKELANFAGARMGFASSLRLAVMSTAANHLPAPGGPLLRMAAFQRAGASLKNAGLANVAAGFIWMSATFFFVVFFAFSFTPQLAAASFCIGVLCLLAALVLGRKLPGGMGAMGRLFVVSAIAAALYATAIHYALTAFGIEGTFASAAVISAAGVLGAAASIAPSGLGVREALAAGLAVIIGAPPAAAFAATAIVHAAMGLLMGFCALYFAGRSRPEAAT